jgi:hypothetical protein
VTPTAAAPIETLYNSDAFPRWTRRLPALDQTPSRAGPDAFPRWTKGAAYTLPFSLIG